MLKFEEGDRGKYFKVQINRGTGPSVWKNNTEGAMIIIINAGVVVVSIISGKV